MEKLYLSVLSRKQLNLLRKLKFLKKYGFYLAGGTALALQIGHRTSIDFDFYTQKKFNLDKLYANLKNKFKKISLLQKAEGTLFVKVNQTVISFFEYPYPLIFPPIEFNDLPPIASKEDIAAMKIIAISTRGTKRDFIDIYFLLKEFSLKEIFQFVKKKYSGFNPYVGLIGLTYFVDAEKEEKRKYFLIQKVSWKKIKEFLIKKAKEYEKTWQE
jgi:predicted nucleotidyltransferase component of viral defense system